MEMTMPMVENFEYSVGYFQRKLLSAPAIHHKKRVNMLISVDSEEVDIISIMVKFDTANKRGGERYGEHCRHIDHNNHRHDQCRQKDNSGFHGP